MGRNNLVLGGVLLGFTGLGVYLYLKEKNIDVLKIVQDRFFGGSSGSSGYNSPATFGISEKSAGITESERETVNNILVQDMRDKGKAYLARNPRAFSSSSSSGGSSSGGSYSLGESISRNGTSTPTVTLSANNSPSQNISIASKTLSTYIGPSGTTDAGYMSVVSSPKRSSVLSQVKNKASSGITAAKNFIGGFF